MQKEKFDTFDCIKSKNFSWIENKLLTPTGEKIFAAHLNGKDCSAESGRVPKVNG